MLLLRLVNIVAFLYLFGACQSKQGSLNQARLTTQDTTFHRIVGKKVLLSIGQQQLLTDSISDMIITVFAINDSVPITNSTITVTLRNRGRTYHPVSVNALTKGKYKV